MTAPALSATSEGPSEHDLAVLRRIRDQSPRLYRKLLKAAKRARGLVPVRTDAGETKHAMRAFSSAVRGERVSGKRARKDVRAMKRHLRSLQPTD